MKLSSKKMNPASFDFKDNRRRLQRRLKEMLAKRMPAKETTPQRNYLPSGASQSRRAQ